MLIVSDLSFKLYWLRYCLKWARNLTTDTSAVTTVFSSFYRHDVFNTTFYFSYGFFYRVI